MFTLKINCETVTFRNAKVHKINVGNSIPNENKNAHLKPRKR